VPRRSSEKFIARIIKVFLKTRAKRGTYEGTKSDTEKSHKQHPDGARFAFFRVLETAHHEPGCTDWEASKALFTAACCKS